MSVTRDNIRLHNVVEGPLFASQLRARVYSHINLPDLTASTFALRFKRSPRADVPVPRPL